MEPLIATFARVLAVGELPLPVAAHIGRECDVLRLSLPAAGALPVHRLLAAARLPGRAAERTLVLTSRPLCGAHSPVLFGYADRPRRTAIVSTASLGFDTAPELALSRFRNVLAHECAHLDGLRHCRTRGCLLSVVGSVVELDARGMTPCGCCPRERANARGAAAALALIGLLALVCTGLDGIARALARAPRHPFACVSAGEARNLGLYFNDRPVAGLEMDGQQPAAVCSSVRTADTLNRLFQKVGRQGLRVSRTGDARAQVQTGAMVLLETAPGERDALAVARGWAREVEWLLLAKGAARDGCPECHAARPVDMTNAVRLRAGG